MRYKILYAQKFVGDRRLSVMDFKLGQILHFDLSRLEETDNSELIKYIKSELKKIEQGHYDYTKKG